MKQAMIKRRMLSSNLIDLVKRYIPAVVFLILLIISSIISDAFFTMQNIYNLLRQLSGTVIISMGMLLVILTGGIDLSVGSVVALTCVLSAYYARTTNLFFAFIITLIFALLVGVFNGYLVAYRKIAPFVVTLATMTASRGIAYIISRGTPIQVQDPIFSAYGKGAMLTVPFPVITAAIVFVVTALLIKYTVFGRFIKAIGSNETAVKLSGIRVNRYKWAAYIIISGLCAFAGIITAGRSGVGSPIVGSGMEMDAIASCVIGGASLSGGRGNAFNVLMGALILGMIGNIMNLMNIAGYPQQVIKGAIIIAAVLLQGNSEAK
jgi:ribose transport system permease protein